MRNRRLFRLAVLAFFLLFTSVVSFAQQRTITGTVLDEEGLPLAGTTVSVKGQMQISTATNKDGIFSLQVPANATSLIFSFVTKATQELSIVEKNVISVVLQPAEKSMEEIVLVGYGKSKRSNLTSAQTSVSSKDIERTVNTTLEQALQGRSAGVYVTQNSGQPGGGVSVNIRGISSLNRTQPLYVIDGVQFQASEDVSYGDQSSANPLAGLNPADIEDMQILQGPSATAIYGSRATNGVILITTKRGKAGDFSINYIHQYNVQNRPQRLNVMNLSQYAQMVNEYQTVLGTPQNVPEQFLDPSILGKGTDWQKELFRSAPMSKHQLSLGGGSAVNTYYMSAEYMKQDGVAEGSGFDRFGFRLNMDNKPKKWLSIGTSLNYNQVGEVLTATNYSAADPIIGNALRLTPQIPVRNIDGSWGGGDDENGAGQYAPVNPLAIANLITNTNQRKQFMGGLNFAITPVKGLTLRTSLNGNVASGQSSYYIPTYEIGLYHRQDINSLTQQNNSSWYWNWNQLVEYNKSFGNHNIGVMASHEAQESYWKNLSGTRTDFLTNDIFDLNAGDPLSATNGGGSGGWAMESYLGRLNYNYDNRYLLTASFRTDGSPFFGPEKRWGTFPSVSAAWRVNQEKFFNVDIISDLKLRLETGITGNQGTGSGIYASMTTGATPWGTGFMPSTFTNPTLQWEETNTKNIGLNIGLWRNRLTIEADFYVKNTDNLILEGSFPRYLGINDAQGAVRPPLVNTGSLQTKGWNLTFNGIIVDKKDFRWESNLNLSRFKSVVTSLNSDNAFLDRTSMFFFGWTIPWTQRSAIGQQPWLFRGYIMDGLYQSVDDINKNAVPVDGNGDRRPAENSQEGIWIGDAKYRDMNGDGKITEADMTAIGNPWPKISGGFTNNFSYKNFELSVLITGVYGNDIYNAITHQSLNPNNVNLSRNFLVDAYNYAKVVDDPSNPRLANPGTNIPRMTNWGPATESNQSRVSSRFVEDGSYLRVKNVSLSYNIPAKLLNYTKIIKGIRAGIGVQNLLTLTKYSGYDPEVGAYTGAGVSSNNQAIGLDFGRYPLTRMYNFSISVNF